MRKFSLLFVSLYLSTLVLHAQTFVNGQAARAVLGQTNFTAGNPTSSQNILGGVGAIAYANGMLWVADSNRVAATPNNHRVLGFPTSEIPGLHDDLTLDNLTNSDCYLCGFNATESLGQSSFTFNNACGSTTADVCFAPGLTQNTFYNATAVATDGHYLAVADTDNNRVLLWNEIPTQMGQNADLVLGQTCFTCLRVPPTAEYVDQTLMRGPQGVWIQNNHLYVADTQDNRILIWNTIPTQNNQPPDLVLGQNNFSSNYQPTPSSTAPTVAANQTLNPTSVTSDGTRLYVSDLGNNRVLIWNEIPTQMDQPADVVLGQPDMTQSPANNPNVCNGYSTGPLLAQCQTSLNYPRFALAVGNQLFVADSGNDRVLIFPLPATNGEAATGVLGEPDFLQDVVSSATISIASTAIDNTGGVDLLPTPQGIAWDGTNLYVSDPYNRRVVLFTPADTPLAPLSVVNWASEITRQEGVVQITLATGITTPVVGDSVSINVNGMTTPYTYTIVKNDTVDTIAEALVKLINGAPDPNVTASFAGVGTGTLYLSSIETDPPLTYDSITLSAVSSNSSDEVVTASGSYLSAGTASTGSIGMLVEINGTNLSATTTNAVLDGVTPLPNRLGGVQVFMDGYPCPLLKVSPSQIVTQIPYFYSDRNSTSVYVRTVHGDGSVTVTTAVPVYIAPANPGIFDAPLYSGQARPWPIAQAYHQPGNPNAVVDFEGAPIAGNIAQIVVQGVTYNYAVTSTDVAATVPLASIVSNMVTLINATDTNVTASVGGAYNRVVLTAKQAGAAGTGITVTATSETTSSNTAVPSDLLLTAYSPATCCNVTPNSPIQIGNPAAPGEMITVTAAGMGPINDPTNTAGSSLGTGVPYAGPAANNVTQFVTATMGNTSSGEGTTAQVVSAFLPEKSYGTYQVQIIVPQGQPTNNTTTLNIAQNAFISNTVTLPVGPAVVFNPGPPAAPPTTINGVIDYPAGGQTVSGVIDASGWALNSQSSLTGVNVYVDEKLVAAASYGYARTDVCLLYTSPDCPNTGWHATFDTSQFPDGQHKISIAALSSNGSDYSFGQTFYISNNPASSSNPYNGSIDAPNANVIYRGTVDFSGWSTISNAATSAVSILVDGAAAGTATYGFQRTDVCALYNSPNCPNVGWHVQLNTDLYGNGSHTLTVKTVGANGKAYFSSQTFQVGNWVGGNTSTSANIETPTTASGAFSGTMAIGGWAGDLYTSVNSVGISIDGVSYGNAAYGFNRPDVCASYAFVGCPNVGFYGTVDTTLLADGQHTLTVTVNLNGEEPAMFTQMFYVSNQATSGNPIMGDIDFPNANATVTGTVTASGWAISKTANDPVVSVAMKIDGISYGNATYGTPRADVCAVEPAQVSCPNVGWAGSIDTTKVSNGTHAFEITVTTQKGERASTNATFTVSNPTTGPGHINVEVPTQGNNPIIGSVVFSGWAVNDNAAVSSVSIAIDGVPYGLSTYGISRPDVCAVYPGRAGCPNVGWSIPINSTQLADGNHTLAVTENNADGTYYTYSTVFIVANDGTTATNPMVITVDSPASLSNVYGNITVAGWAVNEGSSVASVNLTIDGLPLGTATYGISRPDVCAVYPGYPSCPGVGWAYTGFNTALYLNGPHTLGVTATTVNGYVSTYSETFYITN